MIVYLAESGDEWCAPDLQRVFSTYDKAATFLEKKYGINIRACETCGRLAHFASNGDRYVQITGLELDRDDSI